jgi:hypothetical protein
MKLRSEYAVKTTSKLEDLLMALVRMNPKLAESALLCLKNKRQFFLKS